MRDAPVPQVHHLPTIYKMIERGELRIPAFQRKFVWGQRQVLELLQSIYLGYPIGSVLLWSVTTPVLKVEREESAFPELPERYPTTFVLDGMQRLSTLYGVIHNPVHPVMNVHFGLETETFSHLESREDELSMPLSMLSSPAELIKYQRGLLESAVEPELMINKTIHLQTIFQEYLLPTVTIRNEALSEVVEIFKRVNSTGLSLSAVDFMRAMTWSAGFDLGRELDSLKGEFLDRGYDIPAESLMKAISVAVGQAPTPESMLELKEKDEDVLLAAVGRVTEALGGLVKFLQDRLNIWNGTYLPYEGHLLDKIERWIVVTSLSETLRGKPDHYVVRALNDVEKLVEDPSFSFKQSLSLTVSALTERRFIRGKAMTAGFAMLYCRQKPESLVTGLPIDTRYAMRDDSGSDFRPILSTEQLGKALGKKVVSAKHFANLVLETTESNRSVLEDILSANAERLAGHFLSEECVTFLKEGKYSQFLEERSELILDAAFDL